MSLTKKDRQQLIDDFKGVFATKDDLQGIRDELQIVKDDVRAVKDQLKFVPTKDFFLERMDKLTKEIQDAREELAAHTGSHTRIDDDLDDHEIRIEQLEKHTGIPSV